MGVTYIATASTYGATYYDRYSGDDAHVLRGVDTYININATNISSNARVAQSAAAHELGHIFGLEHENAVSNCIMNVTRNRATAYTPIGDDFNGVSFFYRDWNFDTWANPND